MLGISISPSMSSLICTTPKYLFAITVYKYWVLASWWEFARRAKTYWTRWYIQDATRLTIGIVKLWSCWDLGAGLWETSRAAETFAQALWETWCHILTAAVLRVPSPQRISSLLLVFSTVTRFATSLYYLSLSVYIHTWIQGKLVLATVPGYPASVRVGTGSATLVRVRNRQGTRTAHSWRSLPGQDTNTECLAGLNPDRGYIFTVPATFAPIR
jgi:hypothetical protein